MQQALVDLSLDHVGCITRDLRTNAVHWMDLGFTLSPESRQRGRMPNRHESGVWGTANQCAVFNRGYLELIGIVDPALYNPWQHLLKRFEGLHILALRCSSADDAWTTLGARTNTLYPPVARERELDVMGQQKVMRFRNIFAKDECYPEGKLLLIEHQTPQYVWQPRLLEHENGALSLDEVMLVTKDIAATLDRLKVFANTLTDNGNTTVRVKLPDGGTLVVFESEAFVKRFGAAPAELPCLGGITVTFRDRPSAVNLMRSRGVNVVCDRTDWFVPMSGKQGFVLNMASV